MRKMNLKVVVTLILVVCIGSKLFAESAVITYAKGKVEVYRNNEWVAVSIGDSVNESEIISTGFQSEAKLKYNGSVLCMGPVTRISVEELKKEPGKETVNLNLSTGAVRSKVTHTEDTRVSYKVHTPVVTASVRGTDFMVTSGGSVSCYEGAVVVFANKNERRRNGSNAAKAKSKAEEDSESRDSEESDEGETSEDVSTAAPGDYPSATATTDASEISEDAPAGAVVVGANQNSEVTTSGTMQKPMENAEQQSEKAKSYGQSAGEKEAVSAGGSAGAVTSSDKVAEEMQKGSISVTISLSE